MREVYYYSIKPLTIQYLQPANVAGIEKFKAYVSISLFMFTSRLSKQVCQRESERCTIFKMVYI